MLRSFLDPLLFRFFPEEANVRLNKLYKVSKYEPLGESNPDGPLTTPSSTEKPNDEEATGSVVLESALRDPDLGCWAVSLVRLLFATAGEKHEDDDGDIVDGSSSEGTDLRVDFFFFDDKSPKQ